MVMDLDIDNIDLDDVFGEPQYIPINKCVTRVHPARQTHFEVKEDDELVDSIRRVGGIMHPVILQDLKNGEYEIIVGNRRVYAYYILKNEDSKYEKILAYVAKRDLTYDEKKVISFVECYGRKPMERSDYVDVIDYFYKKYCSITLAAEELGITVGVAKKYLTESRLSDKVRALIDAKEFTIDIAINALDSLGEDDESVDDEILIETARILKKLVPSVRKQVLKKLKKQCPGEKDVEKAISEVPVRLTKLQIHVTLEMLDKLKHQMEKNHLDVGDVIIELIDERLAELEDD